MSIVSIFSRPPPLLLKPDAVDEGFSFDAIVRVNAEMKSTYTDYPVEYGANMQDHAYIEPDAITIEGFIGSKELGFNPAELGVSALVGNIDNEYISAIAGVGAEISAGFLAGEEQTKPQATLSKLLELRDSFAECDVVTDLRWFTKMSIDSITYEATIENETGLEFKIEMSQNRKAGIDSNLINAAGLGDDDLARIQGARMADRGGVSLA